MAWKANNVVKLVINYSIVAVTIVSLAWLFAIYSIGDGSKQAYKEQDEKITKNKKLIVQYKDDFDEMKSQVIQMRGWVIDLETNQIIMQEEVGRQ